ncbi:hydantoinase/oxoprolinase family protein [Amycolatopsis sp. K13G38]|uniref:Hydantoinase/oxoprolinase family protein n=1 Tax=Amycolatopsis acididurans TaxID=2724524 RepID=A0ABX1J7L8_9PSEU|nr:hydantoinase/oxoprolinase family protein [Amycolatopsis acididurans]NKQ55564.1 hydantoinase/oxoprolinase family protein [Amycolatopsis acididurans]
MIGVDVGGTFTDIVRVRDGEIETIKVPTNVKDTYKGVLAGASEASAGSAHVFNHASTHGLNALITRRLPKIAFLTTFGHRDMLDMARALRPPEAVTNPHWRRSFSDVSRPIVPRYLRRGIKERLSAAGKVVVPLDEQQARHELEVLRRCRVEGVAICLLNAYVDGAHEERLRALVREILGDVPCSISSEVSPLALEYARASTTTVDVICKIIYGNYSDRLRKGLAELGFRGDLNFADCAAMLAPVDVAMSQPSRILFSGPAAGTMACAHLGRTISQPNLLCADVGGTSCDISVVTGGEPVVNTSFELEHDLIISALSNEVVSVGAGGGSIVRIGPAGELRVGPESAGADPGPACYGRGGTEPTTTDAFLLMGILDGERFAAGRSRLDPELSKAAFENLDSRFQFADRVRFAHQMALNNVAEGITDVVVKNGIDAREYSMVAFGAAGPMMLPAILDHLPLKSVIVPPYPGLFSALGLVSADQVHADKRSAYRLLEATAAEEIDAIYGRMEASMRAALGSDAERAQFVRSFDGQLVGQVWDTPLVPVPAGTITPDAVGQMITNFHDAYEQRSGNRFSATPVQGVTYRLHAVIPTDKVAYPAPARRTSRDQPRPRDIITLRYLEGDEIEAGEYQRAELLCEDVVTGPAVIREPLSTTFVGLGQVATIGTAGEIVITRVTD